MNKRALQTLIDLIESQYLDLFYIGNPSIFDAIVRRTELVANEQTG